MHGPALGLEMIADVVAAQCLAGAGTEISRYCRWWLSVGDAVAGPVEFLKSSFCRVNKMGDAARIMCRRTPYWMADDSVIVGNYGCLHVSRGDPDKPERTGD